MRETAIYNCGHCGYQLPAQPIGPGTTFAECPHCCAGGGCEVFWREFTVDERRQLFLLLARSSVKGGR